MQGCKTACPYCGVGCGVEVTQDKIAGDAHHQANHGALCVKGSALGESIELPNRLLYPKYKGKPIAWQSAIEHIAESFHDAVINHGEDSVAMYVSGQLLTEDYYVANKFMKGYIGSANIDTNSRLCMSSAVAAQVRAFGEDVVPVNYQDLEQTDLIVICGANTAWTHPILFRRIERARANNPDLKLVVIDPRETVTASEADLHLAVNNDEDVALFNGLMRACIDAQMLNREFIESSTNGFEDIADEVLKRDYEIESVSTRTGIPTDKLRQFFDWFMHSDRAVTLYCQGVNQSESGVDKANAIINVHLATGKIAKQGCGPFSITGQPNAMGGREVGGLANQLAVHRDFDKESREQVQDFWSSPKIANKAGLKAVELFEAAANGEIKVLWIMATNPIVSLPDSALVEKALERCPLVIVSDICGDSDIAQHADLLLPAAGWGEKQGMVTNSERRMTRQRAFIDSPGETKADWWAISEVAKAYCTLMDFDTQAFGYKNERDIFVEYAGLTGINKNSPYQLDISDCSNLSLSDYENWQPTQWGGDRPYCDGVYSHADGKARFIKTVPIESNRTNGFWLNSGRSRDQWHTMTRTGHVARLAASELEPTTYLSSSDAEQLGVKQGDYVSLNSDGLFGTIAKVGIDDGLTDKQAFMSMHWAGGFAGIKNRVNNSVQRKVDPISGQPAFKSSPVQIEPVLIAMHGLFIGEEFQQTLNTYATYQPFEKLGAWRFVETDALDIKTFNLSSSERRIVLSFKSTQIAISYRLVTNQKLVSSLLLVSDEPISANAEYLQKLIDQPLSFEDLYKTLANEKVSKSVCSCMKVSEESIVNMLEAKPQSSLEDLQDQLGCGTKCGSCIPQLKTYLKQIPIVQI